MCRECKCPNKHEHIRFLRELEQKEEMKQNLNPKQIASMREKSPKLAFDNIKDKIQKGYIKQAYKEIIIMEVFIGKCGKNKYKQQLHYVTALYFKSIKDWPQVWLYCCSGFNDEYKHPLNCKLNALAKEAKHQMECNQR